MVLNEYLPKDCLDYLINEFFVPAKKHVSIVKFLQFCVDTCCDSHEFTCITIQGRVYATVRAIIGIYSKGYIIAENNFPAEVNFNPLMQNVSKWSDAL